jgi:hypothetical protein
MAKMTGAQNDRVISPTIGVIETSRISQYIGVHGALPPRKTENMLVAGRRISTDAQTHAFMREIPQCRMTGHAAGVAAALSVNAGLRQRVLPVALQAALRAGRVPADT